jgi:hypothetical protein
MFALASIKIIRRTTNDKPIAQATQSFQQSDMANVKKIECAVCDDSFHDSAVACFWSCRARDHAGTFRHR